MPLLVGGAALSEKFTNTRIGPAYGDAAFYAKDAMTGLRIMNQLMDPATREQRCTTHIFTTAGVAARSEAGAAPINSRRRAAARCAPTSRFRLRPISTARVRDVPQLPKSGATSIPTCSMAGISASKAISRRLLAERDPKALELFNNVEEVKHEAAKFMKVRRSGSSSKPSATATRSTFSRRVRSSPLHTFHFGRQPRAEACA